MTNLDIPSLDHVGLLSHLGLHRVMEPDTEDLMRELNERGWREDEHDSPHEDPWHSAFHGSQFPGDDPDACVRRLLYRMMNFPSVEPVKPWVTTTATVGSAGEQDITRAWHEGGRALSAHPDSPYQTYFEDREFWLTASCDLVILKPFWLKPHVCEIKSKASEVIAEMMRGQRRWDAPHRRQILASLGRAHEEHPWRKVVLCGETWRLPLIQPGEDGKVDDLSYQCRVHHEPYEPGTCLIEVELEPADTGSIYYWDRSWPRGKPGGAPGTVEFFFQHDPDFMAAGRAYLTEARRGFEEDVLPPRPDGFMWSLGACQYCDFKKTCCKPDDKDEVTRLSESHGVEWTRSIRPHYDVEQVREVVLRRWRDG